MAGTATPTEYSTGSIKKISWSWTSDGDGDSTGTTTGNYDGFIVALKTVPDGDDAPTADYDITITDEDGDDILAGQGADRHTSDTETVFNTADTPMLGVYGSKLTLTVANAGDTKAGTATIWIR